MGGLLLSPIQSFNLISKVFLLPQFDNAFFLLFIFISVRSVNRQK